MKSSPENRPPKLHILRRNLVLAQFLTGFSMVVSELHYRTAKVRFEAQFRRMILGVLLPQPTTSWDALHFPASLWTPLRTPCKAWKPLQIRQSTCRKREMQCIIRKSRNTTRSRRKLPHTPTLHEAPLRSIFGVFRRSLCHVTQLRVMWGHNRCLVSRRWSYRRRGGSSSWNRGNYDSSANLSV